MAGIIVSIINQTTNYVCTVQSGKVRQTRDYVCTVIRESDVNHGICVYPEKRYRTTNYGGSSLAERRSEEDT
jgi:hypothetical protein